MNTNLANLNHLLHVRISEQAAEINWYMVGKSDLDRVGEKNRRVFDVRRVFENALKMRGAL